MKLLQITMPDYSVWNVRADLIAEDRAEYYDEFKNEDFREIFNETLENPDILIDWAENNMDWDTIKANAIKIKEGKVDYEDGWRNGHKKIIEA